jgi:two-component sensor histidine kinase
LKKDGERFGAIVLCRDVTQVRLREKEMITKDATIREIHHRVKNNLQTVASLLRIQTRRTHSDVVKDALGQAMRRVAAIAVVHDTLSEGLSQNVDFDVVLDRVLMLVAEVASAGSAVVRPETRGSVGILPSEYATPLALVLTELVTNAVEHGLRGKADGHVIIESRRSPESLTISVTDNGGGLEGGKVGDGLGTQIVRTLVDGELGGSIEWHHQDSGGTEVRIEIPLQFLRVGGDTSLVPGI